MAVAAVRTPAEYESRLRRYVLERSEEARAVRVGEKETSEQAEIVARYADLFSREQLDALREAEADAPEAERERLYRLLKTCEGGIITAELAAQSDELENALLAAKVPFQGEELPLRTAQARLAVLPDYREREELGNLQADVSSSFNERRLELIRAGEELEADVSGDPEPGAPKRGGEGHLAARARRRPRPREQRRRRVRTARCASAGSTGCSGPSASRCRRPSTPRTSAGSRRWSRRTRRSAPSRSASTRLPTSASTSRRSRSSSTSRIVRRSRRGRA